MASRRSFSWGSFFAGALAVLLVIVVAGGAIVLGGLYPVAASSGDPTGVAAILKATRERAVERSAKQLKAPQFSAEAILEGGSHFKGMCQQCHGGPGAKREEFAGGMNPRPPDLARTTGDLSAAEIFWIEKNGLKMTGMPAFGATDEDDELWKIAAFVKQLPKIDPDQYAAIPKAQEKGDEHGGGD